MQNEEWGFNHNGVRKGSPAAWTKVSPSEVLGGKRVSKVPRGGSLNGHLGDQQGGAGRSHGEMRSEKEQACCKTP